MKVWILFVMFYSSGYGANSVTIENLTSMVECQRVSFVLERARGFGGTTKTLCVEVIKK